MVKARSIPCGSQKLQSSVSGVHGTGNRLANSPLRIARNRDVSPRTRDQIAHRTSAGLARIAEGPVRSAHDLVLALPGKFAQRALILKTIIAADPGDQLVALPARKRPAYILTGNADH